MLFHQHHTNRGSSWPSQSSQIALLQWTLPDKLIQARSKWRAWTASFFVARGRLHDKQPKDTFIETLITILFPFFPLFLAKILLYWISWILTIFQSQQISAMEERVVLDGKNTQYLLRFPIIRWRGVHFFRPLQYNLGKSLLVALHVQGFQLLKRNHWA